MREVERFQEAERLHHCSKNGDQKIIHNLGLTNFNEKVINNEGTRFELEFTIANHNAYIAL